MTLGNSSAGSGRSLSKWNALNYIRSYFITVHSRSEVLIFVGYLNMLLVTEEYMLSSKRKSD
jgi:hypothetical protein